MLASKSMEEYAFRQPMYLLTTCYNIWQIRELSRFRRLGVPGNNHMSGLLALAPWIVGPGKVSKMKPATLVSYVLRPFLNLPSLVNRTVL